MSLLLKECLENKYGNYLMPLLWYAGEDKATVEEEINAIKAVGINEFIVENRQFDKFLSPAWLEVFRHALEVSKALGMKVWLLDDLRAGVGFANNALKKERNAELRMKNLRVSSGDFVGPQAGASLMLPPMSDDEYLVYVIAKQLDEAGEPSGRSINLGTEAVDGILPFDIPDGFWRVYFIIKSSNKMTPSTEYHISMLSKRSCDLMIEEVYEKVYANFGEYFGTTFAGFFSDEPLYGNTLVGSVDGGYAPKISLGDMRYCYPWWGDMLEKLARELGAGVDEVALMLPGLWECAGSDYVRLRFAYMDIITDAWRCNFSRNLGDWCGKHNVMYIGHVVEDMGTNMRMGYGCGHFFRSMEGQSMAGLDVVLSQIIPGITDFKNRSNSSRIYSDPAFYLYTLGKLGASLAHITPHMQNRVVCEVFGAYGWGCGLRSMKYIMDNMLVCGTTHFIPHTYSMVYPGSLFPPTFYAKGNNPQYKLFGDLVGYAQRMCHLLNGGIHNSDIALYYNAESEWVGGGGEVIHDVARTVARSGIDYDFLPSDAILANTASVRDGLLTINNESYSMLLVSPGQALPKARCEAFAKLCGRGLRIVFVNDFPRCDDGRRLEDICGGFEKISLDKLGAFCKASVAPHLNIESDSEHLRYYGLKKDDGRIVYMFFNDSTHMDIDTHVVMPIDGACVIYDGWTNKAYCAEIHGRRVRLKIAKGNTAVVIVGSAEETYAAFDYSEPEMHKLELKYDIYVKEANVDDDFRLLRRASDAVNLTKEEALTKCCGTFRYDCHFECDSSAYTAIEITGTGDCGELLLNGVSCGKRICAPYRFDVTGKINKGVNNLSIFTYDNPVYSDRKNPTFSWLLPMLPHGFVGDILIG